MTSSNDFELAYSPETKSNVSQTVNFKLGGQKQNSHYVHFEFSIDVPLDEIDTLSHQTSAIDALSITLDSLDEATLRTLRGHFESLFALSCIQNHPESLKYLKNKIHSFFGELTSHALSSPITLGHPGGLSDAKKVTELHTKIGLVNHTLNLLKIPTISIQLSLAKPESTVSEGDMLGLPSSLAAFRDSINTQLTANVDLWKAHFRIHTIPQLKTYLTTLLTAIEQIDNNSERLTVFSDLHRFIEYFKESHPTQMTLFSELYDMSQQSPCHRQPVELITLYQAIDKLLKAPPEDFIASFSAFQETLSDITQKPHIDAEGALVALHHHLHAQKNDSPQANQVKSYISHSLSRCAFPITGALQTTLEALLNIYEPPIPSPNPPKHNADKAAYLRHLMDIIRINPEKSYAKCCDIAAQSTSNQHVKQAIQYALNPSYAPSHSYLATKHRFTSFIHTLISTEPKYESLEPPTHTAPTHP